MIFLIKTYLIITKKMKTAKNAYLKVLKTIGRINTFIIITLIYTFAVSLLFAYYKLMNKMKTSREGSSFWEDYDCKNYTNFI